MVQTIDPKVIEAREKFLEHNFKFQQGQMKSQEIFHAN